MPASRAIHFWDGETYVGEWFAEKVERYRGVSWDVYYLYGHDIGSFRRDYLRGA